jgi:hypothetical protein
VSAARCDCCQENRPAGELYEPYPGVIRCRDIAACQGRLLFPGTGAPPFTPVRPAPVPGAGPCAICGSAGPPGGVYERTPGTAICRDRGGCDGRAVETQYLTAHSEEFRTAYTSPEMRAAAVGAVAQVAADVPADVTEARQAAAKADLGYGLAAAGRRR